MIAITGYQFGESIHESVNSIVYRGQRRSDNRPVILKILKEAYPSPEQIVSFKKEYELLKKLDIKGVIEAYALEKRQQRWVMVLEDFGGKSLAQLGVFGRLDLVDFLNLAIKITQIIGQIHQRYIIHKDINPANILVVGYTPPPSFSPGDNNHLPATTQGLARWEVKLIDFGISTVLSADNPTISNPDVLEGTLAYISPEQTGRMNRAMDYRSDYYSLGATFYELLTGQLPFKTNDALELVHAHIAKQPTPPVELKPELPQIVSDIILKLMAKNAEDRYQSAYGLKADLEKSLEQYQETGTIEPFPLGQEDISDKLQIPQKLYGRTTELDQLLTAFETINTTAKTELIDRNEAERLSNRKLIPIAQMMIVKGEPGVGKTALVHELHKPITHQRGYFISGKFDRFQHDTPHASFIQAFRGLVQQLLMESPAQIMVWKQTLAEALGTNGQVIIDVIPEMTKIIGPQPPVPKLGPLESQNRFNLVFQKFVDVFARPQHPLVIFLDDLHWADDASLQLIERLLTAPERHALFIIGAYRTKEVYHGDPLLQLLDDVKQAGVTVQEISLIPLVLDDITQLVNDTFHCELETAQALAETILEKTDGNPYFIGEFLKSLHIDGLVRFRYRIGSWQWDITQIRKQAVTDNVVQLMADKLRRLPPETQELVKLAACVGQKFDLETLALTSDKGFEQTAAELWAAVSDGLVLMLNRSYHFDDNGDDVITAEYKFAHDRVQQAIYSLITETERQTLHWRIGQLILRYTIPDQRGDRLFDLVNHLNLGRHISVTHSEWDELAQLNLEVGQKAKAATAYQQALNYLGIGIELLDLPQSPLIRGANQRGGSWQRQYNLTLSLHIEAAEAAYLCGEFEQMEHLADMVLQNGKSLLDKVPLYEIKMRAYIAQNNLSKVVQTALPVLRLLGVRFPRTPNEANITMARHEIELALAGRSIETLVNLPKMTDAYRLAAMQLLSVLSSAAYFSNPELLPLVVFKMVTLSVKHGSAPESMLAYTAYGLILCGDLDDIETGYQFGNLSLKLLNQSSDQHLKARTLFEINTYIRHWKEGLSDSLAPLLTAYQNGLETGDLEYAARAAYVYSFHAYSSGNLLPELIKKISQFNDSISNIKQDRAWRVNELYRQTTLILMGDQAISTYEIPTEDEKTILTTESHSRSVFFHGYLNKAILHYVFADYEQALDNLSTAEHYLDSVTAMYAVPLFYFYDSLIRLALFAESGSAAYKQGEVLQRVATNQKMMEQWMQHAPMNFLHKFYLVEAEYARVLGRDGIAREYYDKAILLTQEYHFINEEALANELATRFYLTKSQSEIAQIYLQKAHYAYNHWGAKAKVNELEEQYPEMLMRPQHNFLPDTPITTSVSRTQSIMGALDLTSVLKASQTISGEIILDKLLIKMMRLVIENAGAERGYLLLNKRGQWVIEAESNIDTRQVTVLQSQSIINSPSQETDNNQPSPILPRSIINYVDHTHETVVLKDATRDNQFAQDPYIKINKPVSVLCMPLIHQGKITGLIYLENNLTSDAFTPARLEVLKLLSAQAAISIENARFHAHQIELTKAYSRFVPSQILSFLKKESIIEVQLADQIQQEMTVLFSDIRSFTSLLEQMTPEQSFRFINSYLGRVSPIIREHNGFIDKYIGDAIMALFPEQPSDAIEGAIAMQQAVQLYNVQRARAGYQPIKIGAGLHTGNVMLGIVGEEERMEGTVISDAVNLASRLEGLTKMYGASIVISEQTLFSLDNPNEYKFRFLDKVKVKGKKEPVAVFEILEGIPEAEIELKQNTQQNFEQGLLCYHTKAFIDAKEYFENVVDVNPNDKAALLYLRRVKHFQEYGVPVDWEGVESLTEK